MGSGNIATLSAPSTRALLEIEQLFGEVQQRQSRTAYIMVAGKLRTRDRVYHTAFDVGGVKVEGDVRAPSLLSVEGAVCGLVNAVRDWIVGQDRVGLDCKVVWRIYPEVYAVQRRGRTFFNAYCRLAIAPIATAVFFPEDEEVAA